MSFEQVKPGYLVDAKVKKVVDNGLFVVFCGGIEGIIFEDHCEKKLSEYKPKDVLQARVTYIDF